MLLRLVGFLVIVSLFSTGFTVVAGCSGNDTSCSCKDRPTLLPHTPFNATADAKKIIYAARRAPNEKEIRRIIITRSNWQRQQINRYLKEEHNFDLNVEIQNVFSYGLMTQTLLKALMMSPLELMTHDLFEAMDGIGTKENVLTEIICTKKSNQEMMDLVEFYDRRNKIPLKKKICGDTSGDFRNFLINLTTANRNNETQVNEKRTRNLINNISAFLDYRMDSDGSIVSTILIRESYAQLKDLIEKYPAETGQTLQAALKEYFGGDYLDAMLAVVDSIQDVHAFYARRLYEAMEGIGTDDRTLIRIIVLRSEIDLGCIKDVFQKLYGDTLESYIKSETSGPYRDTILELVREN